MADLNTLFRNFLTQCGELNRALTPVAIVLFVVGIVSSTTSGQRSASAYVRHRQTGVATHHLSNAGTPSCGAVPPLTLEVVGQQMEMRVPALASRRRALRRLLLAHHG